MCNLKKILLCLFLLTGFVLPVSAAAITSGNVVNFADTLVPADSTMDTVIVIGGNAFIAGNVREDVVVLNGNATLASTANVRKRVLVLGGNLETEPGASIGKGVFQIGGNFAMASALASAGLIIALLGLIKIAVTLTLISIPVILTWFCKTQVQEMSGIVQRNPVKTAWVGFLGGLALATVSLVLSITLIGIPVAILFIMAALAVSLMGLAGICCALGQALPFSVPTGERHTFFCTLYGAILLALLFNVPFIGVVAVKLSLLMAFGIMIIKFVPREPKDG